MIFNSLTYIVFLFIVVSLYWTIPRQPRLLLIFFSSLIFYGFWRLEFIPLLLFSTFSDYFIARGIGASNRESVRKFLLKLSIFINISLLLFFKYLIFFANNFYSIANMIGFQIDPFALNIILPLGISFYTFQTISYVVDVYRKVVQPENNFLVYGSYVIFFPQLIAGPVLRASEVIGQLNTRPPFRFQYLIEGLKRIIFGLFLKVVLADNIASIVDTGFDVAVSDLSALDVYTLAFLFGFQIYFDFSAYSHIAIGSAKLLGINFPENFNFPYIAKSPRDFWKRWHISLSSWIRDYLYLPLIGSKPGNNSKGGLENVFESKKTKALFTSWAIMGFWHGANWTFLIWGLYHAVVIYIYRYFKVISKNWLKIPTSISSVFTLLIMMIGWIPFRANDIETAFSMWAIIFSPNNYIFLGLRENTYLVAFLVLVGMYLVEFFHRKKPIQNMPIFRRLHWVLEILFYATIMILVFIYLRPMQQFIYFQF